MHCSFSAGCSDTWACSGMARSAAHAATTSIAAGSTARTEWMAAPMRTPARRLERARPGRPGERVAVAEATLDRVGLRPDAAVEVTGVEQRDPDAGVAGRRQQGGTHRVGIVVGLPPGLVVEVVELADRGHPGQRHLGEHGPGQSVIALRVEGGGDAVHLVAPRPERTLAATMGPPAQYAVEGVAVGVGEAGQRQPGQPGRARRRGRRHAHSADAVTVEARTSTPAVASSPPSQASSQWNVPGLPPSAILSGRRRRGARRAPSPPGPNHGPSPAGGVLGHAGGVRRRRDRHARRRMAEPVLEQRLRPRRDTERSERCELVGGGARPTSPPAAKGRIRITPRPSSAASGRILTSTSRSSGL